MTGSKKIAIVLAAIAAIAIGIGFFMFFSEKADKPDSTEVTAGTPEVTASPTANVPSTSPEPPKDAKLTETQDLQGGGGVRIASIASVTSQAEIPGEVVGPAIQVTLEVEAGKQAVDLNRVVVNAYYGKTSRLRFQPRAPALETFRGRSSLARKPSASRCSISRRLNAARSRSNLFTADP